MDVKILLLICFSAACGEQNVIDTTEAVVIFLTDLSSHATSFRNLVTLANFDNKPNLPELTADMTHCFRRNRGPAQRIIHKIRAEFALQCLTDDSQVFPSSRPKKRTFGEEDTKACVNKVLDSAYVSDTVTAFLEEKFAACDNGVVKRFHDIWSENGVGSKMFAKHLLSNAMQFASEMIVQRCDAMKKELDVQILTRQSQELLDIAWRDVKRFTGKLNTMASEVFKKNVINELIYEKYENCITAQYKELSEELSTYTTEIENCFGNIYKFKNKIDKAKLALTERVDALRKQQVEDLKTFCVIETIGDVNHVSVDDVTASINCIENALLMNVEDSIREVEMETSDFIVASYEEVSDWMSTAPSRAVECFVAMKGNGITDVLKKQTKHLLACVAEEIRKEVDIDSVVTIPAKRSNTKSSEYTEDL